MHKYIDMYVKCISRDDMKIQKELTTVPRLWSGIYVLVSFVLYIFLYLKRNKK